MKNKKLNNQKKVDKKTNKGFALLFTVLLVSITLIMAIGVSSVARNQIILTSTANEANKAFYAADTGIECALYHAFKLGSDDVSFSCAEVSIVKESFGSSFNYDDSEEESDGFNIIDDGIDLLNNTCVRVNVAVEGEKTNIESRGYNVPCSDIYTNSRRVERAIRVSF